MKPRWSDAPYWASWLAMDGDGFWAWYENEPRHMPAADDAMAWWVGQGGKRQPAYMVNTPSAETLEPRP